VCSVPVCRQVGGRLSECPGVPTGRKEGDVRRKPAEFRVDVWSEGPGPPLAVRLRRWLKAGLRVYCVRAVALLPPDGPEVAETGEVTADAALDVTTGEGDA
jgi:hypothetical protein